MNWYLKALKQYAVFRGRAHRKEYWMFALVTFVIMFCLSLIEGIFKGPGVLGTVYSLAVLVPSLAVGVRRLHDAGHSGWWLLISFVPLVGAIVLLVFMIQDSQPEENPYGPNPKKAA